MTTTIDIDAMEVKVREQIAAENAELDAKVAAGTADPEFAKAQKLFDEARVQFILAGMHASNAGLEAGPVVAAAAVAIGIMNGNMLRQIGGDEDLAEFYLQWISKSTDATVTGEPGFDSAGSGDDVEIVFVQVQ